MGYGLKIVEEAKRRLVERHEEEFMVILKQTQEEYGKNGGFIR